jgi:catechol 2,3-dioxygenase-like lactoylglutathione lyase family enzyme
MSSTPAIQTLQTGHVGLNVSDLARSRRFYEEVFGFDVVDQSERDGRRYVFLSDGQRLVLTLWEQSEGHFATDRPGLHHLSFLVDSVDEVRAYEHRLQRIGARFHYHSVVPHAEGLDSGGIFFEDPDGIRLEVSCPAGAGSYAAPVSDGPSCGFF